MFRRPGVVLTLPVPIPEEEKKSSSIFIFAFLCGASKGFTSTLSLKRYKKVREFLYVVDNTEKDKPVNKSDKCFKVNPLLEVVGVNCNKTEPKDNHSLDEQMWCVARFGTTT